MFFQVFIILPHLAGKSDALHRRIKKKKLLLGIQSAEGGLATKVILKPHAEHLVRNSAEFRSFS